MGGVDVAVCLYDPTALQALVRVFLDSFESLLERVINQFLLEKLFFLFFVFFSFDFSVLNSCLLKDSLRLMLPVFKAKFILECDRFLLFLINRINLLRVWILFIILVDFELSGHNNVGREVYSNDLGFQLSLDSKPTRCFSLPG